MGRVPWRPPPDSGIVIVSPALLQQAREDYEDCHCTGFLIAGSLTEDVGVVHQHGLDAIFCVLYESCTLEDALENAARNIRLTARNIATITALNIRY